MSKKKASKDLFSDLDDALGDLLGEDDHDKPKKKTAVAGKPKPVPKAKKPNLDDDEFYRQLAAQAGVDEISDISEADPAEMAKSIDGLDDMDASLFKPKNTAQANPNTTAAKSVLSPRSTTTTKPAMTSPRGLKPAASPQTRGSVISPRDFKPTPAAQPTADVKQKSKPKAASKPYSDFDEDDPLAGLLSSEDELSTPRPKPILKKPTTPDSRPGTGGATTKSDDSGSRRLDIDRPPTRSGNYTPEPQTTGQKKGARRQDEAMFDDDTDVLGGMGLDSPTREKPTYVPSADDPLPGGAKSVMDDLLGSGETYPAARPGTGDRKGFVLDAKYTAQGQGQKKVVDEDFTFGAYMPSSAGGSRSNSRRNVRMKRQIEDLDQEVRKQKSKYRKLQEQVKKVESRLQGRQELTDPVQDAADEYGNSSGTFAQPSTLKS